MGIYEINNQGGSRSLFIGILFIVYGVLSLVFFLMELNNRKQR